MADDVHQILKGAGPGDIPIYQPTRLELLINLKTAKALALTLPPAPVARADQVIDRKGLQAGRRRTISHRPLHRLVRADPWRRGEFGLGCGPMNDPDALFGALRNSADPEVFAAIETLVRDGEDRQLCRINVLAFAAKHGLQRRKGHRRLPARLAARPVRAELERAVPGLRRRARLKPAAQVGAQGGLRLRAVLEGLRADARRDGRGRLHGEPARAADRGARSAHAAGAGILPPDLLGHRHRSAGNRPRSRFWKRSPIDSIELGPGEKGQISVQLPAAFVIVFEPVTHAAHFIDVKGEPTKERQTLSLIYDKVHAPTITTEMRPGPLRLSLDNRSDVRALPSLWIADHTLHDLLGKRRPFLTAKLLLTNQTFRDIYRTDTLDVDQGLKITSLTFLFTDLKGSTELYERVGDIVAYDLVREHFRVLNEIVASEAGAVVKTIGDAVMATFPSPDRALAAALRDAQVRARAEEGSADQDRHPRGAVPRGDAQRPARLFRPDRQHRGARAGPCQRARDLRHQAGGGASAGRQDARSGQAGADRAARRACAALPTRWRCFRFRSCERSARRQVGATVLPHLEGEGDAVSGREGVPCHNAQHSHGLARYRLRFGDPPPRGEG